MSRLRFSTSVVGGERAIASVLQKSIASYLDKQLESVLPSIRDAVADAVKKSVLASSEYFEITQGPIWHELGIPRPVETVGKIIDQVGASVSVQKTAGVTSTLDIGFRVGILPADYQDLLSLPEASFLSRRRLKSSNGKRGAIVSSQVEWLKWLLLEGGGVIISDYHYQAIASRASRTGFGLMSPSNDGWSVPPEVAGTSENNWLTRAVRNNLDIIKKTIIDAVNERL